MSTNFIDFSNRLTVVTGASGGLGKEIAILLSNLNAKLLLLGRNEDRLNDTLKELEGKGHEVCSVDLSKVDLLKSELTPIIKSIGRVYGFCHCAGVVAFRPLNTSKPELLRELMNINVYAGIELARIFANRTIATESEGSMVFVSSICGDLGSPGQVAYCASKGAVNSAMRSLAVELAGRNIKVNSVSPGVIRTEMTDEKSGLKESQIEAILNRYPLANGTPLDVARAVAFLLAPENAWITGVDLKVDGGFSAQ